MRPYIVHWQYKEQQSSLKKNFPYKRNDILAEKQREQREREVSKVFIYFNSIVCINRVEY
jgi:hypothetical protein